MGGDRKAGHNKEKKNNGEESKRSKSADLESDKKTMKEEDSGGPSMSTRGRKRKRGEDGPSQNNLPGDTETGRKKRKKRKEEESPVQKSSRGKRKEKDDGQSASESSSTNKEEENGKSVESRLVMGGDRKAGHNKEKKNYGEESKRSKCADLESDKKTMKEEDSGGPSMSTRGRKRKRGEDGPSHDNLPGDTETGRKKRKKENEDESPVQKSSGRKRKEKDEGQSANASSSTNKEGKSGKSVESRSEQGVVDAIPSLPDLAQDKVFEFLSLRDRVRVAQVGSSWRDAACRPHRWSKLTPEVKLSIEMVSTLKSRHISGVKVTTLCKGLKKRLVEFNTLKHLVLSARNTAILLKSVSSDEKFKSLKTLSLCTSYKWQTQSLMQSLQCFPNLQSLTIESIMTDRVLEAIGDQLKGLLELKLVNKKPDLRLNLKAFGRLRSLCTLYLYNMEVEGIQVLSELSSTLKVLSLTACNTTGDDWIPVLSQLVSLEKLTIIGCLPSVNSDGLRLLAQALTNLKKFAWMYDSLAPDNNDYPCREIAKMSKLHDLLLHYGLKVTDDDVIELCASLKHLRVLTVKFSCFITCEGIKQISGLFSLTELWLEYGIEGKDWLKIVAQGSCKLKKLALVEFSNSDGGMEHLAQMSTLRNLTLRKVKLEATGVAHLNKATFHLDSLEMIYCGVTLEGLIPLLQKQTSSLRMLILVEMTGTPRAEVPYLRTVLPHLEKCSVFNWNPKEFDWANLLNRLCG